jgi:hypothetical protein
MQCKKVELIGVTALLLLTSVVANANDSVCAIERQPRDFDKHNVTLEGSVTDLNETTSRKGNDYTTFRLKDPSGCRVKIFKWGHPAISDGEQVWVEGKFETETHNGPYIFYNEVRAEKIAPASH